MMMTPLIASLFAASSMAGTSPFTAAQPASEAELADMRGGFTLPNGITVSMVVQSQTVLNGTVILHSVFKLDEGPPKLTVFSGGSSQSTAPAASPGLGGGVAVQFSPQGGVVITRQPAFIPGVSVTTGGKAQESGNGGTPLALNPDGTPVTGPGGAVSLQNMAQGSRVLLERDGLSVSHLFGNGFGSVIANSGDNRVIDTFTTISLNLGNVNPYVLGSTLFRVEGVALEATRMMIR